MKYKVRLLVMVLAVCLNCACGGDDAPEKDEPRQPETSTSAPGASPSGKVTVAVTAQSIESGAVVNAETVRSLTLTYSAEITISRPELITINGRIITGASTEGNQLFLPLTLSPGTAYSVLVNSCALSAGENASVKTFTLDFRTLATVNTDNVDAQPCDDGAGEKTLIEYDYLLSHYGKKTMSGVVEGDISVTTGAENVYNISHCYPLIVKYDFCDIFVADYSDMSHVVKHCEAGGMVSFGWDWQVPSREGDSPEMYSSQAGCGFSVRRALIDIYWEFAFVESSISRVAEHLQVLEDAGVTVLFNPMSSAQSHWWGEGGAPYFRELWKLLFDRLSVKYDLDNLIWVWTTEAENYTASQLKEWYPGDEYVDIIGVNMVDTESALQAERFLFINETFGGKKMLALTSCAAVPDINACHENGDIWLYFTADGAAPGWSAAMKHFAVVNRTDR